MKEEFAVVVNIKCDGNEDCCTKGKPRHFETGVGIKM